MKKTFLTALLMSLVLLGMVSCGKKDLDRSEAELLLAQDAQIRRLSEIAYAIADMRPLQDYGVNCVYSPNDLKVGKCFTPDDREIFSIDRNDFSQVTLASGVDFAIKITGIKTELEGGNFRVVQFDWDQNRLPSIVKIFASNGGTGEAQLQLYDDGWRVESSKLSPAAEQQELTAADSEELARFKELHQQRILAQEREKQLLFEKIEEKYLEAIKYSASLITASGSSNSHGTITNFFAEVGSNGIIFKISGGMTGKTKVGHIPFANIREFRTGATWDKKKTLAITQFCKSKYPHVDMGGANPFLIIESNQFDKFYSVFIDNFEKWRLKYPEFYGVDWQKPHYGSTCT